MPIASPPLSNYYPYAPTPPQNPPSPTFPQSLSAPPVTPPSTPVVPVKVNSSPPWIIFLLLFLILILASTTIFFAFQYAVLIPLTVAPLTPLATTISPTPLPPLPVETPDPTADWLLYTSLKYGFSLKYPNSPDWHYDNTGTITEELVNFSNLPATASAKKNIDPLNNPTWVKFSLTRPQTDTDMYVWYSHEITVNDPVTHKPPVYTSPVPVTVGNRPGIRYSLTDRTSGLSLPTVVTIDNQQHLLVISCSLNCPANLDSFNALVSSLTFNQTP